MPQRQKILFVCSQNRIRSLTAEKLLEDHHLYEVRSAGTDHDARIPVTAGHIGWADRIFVMETRHVERLRKKFRSELKGKEVVCLFIPDEYSPLADDLCEILRARLAPYLELSASGGALPANAADKRQLTGLRLGAALHRRAAERKVARAPARGPAADAPVVRPTPCVRRMQIRSRRWRRLLPKQGAPPID